MPNRLVVAINGYGAPADPSKDANLIKYLTYVLAYCRLHEARDIEIHLLGGYTNRVSLSEAEAMRIALRTLPYSPNIREVILHDSTTDLRGNCQSLKAGIQDGCEVTYFCEQSRTLVTKLITQRYLGNANVIGVPFDATSLRLWPKLMQRYPKFWIEWLADTYGGPFEKFRLWLRSRHIKRHQVLAQKP